MCVCANRCFYFASKRVTCIHSLISNVESSSCFDTFFCEVVRDFSFFAHLDNVSHLTRKGFILIHDSHRTLFLINLLSFIVLLPHVYSPRSLHLIAM